MIPKPASGSGSSSCIAMFESPSYMANGQASGFRVQGLRFRFQARSVGLLGLGCSVSATLGRI